MLATGPLGYWSLDELSGPAIDLAGGAHDATPEGAPARGLASLLPNGEGAAAVVSQGNRFFVPEAPPPPPSLRPPPRVIKRPKKPRWRLETSCWADRKAKDGDFFEGPDSMRRLFESDWALAKSSHELAWFIVKSNKVRVGRAHTLPRLCPAVSHVLQRVLLQHTNHHVQTRSRLASAERRRVARPRPQR